VAVDVFNGSGKVILSIPNEWGKGKFYNDPYKHPYFIFKVLQDDRKRKKLERRLRNCFAHETIFQELKRTCPKSGVNIAFKTIYLHTFSFSGVGTSFKRF